MLFTSNPISSIKNAQIPHSPLFLKMQFPIHQMSALLHTPAQKRGKLSVSLFSQQTRFQPAKNEYNYLSILQRINQTQQ